MGYAAIVGYKTITNIFSKSKVCVSFVVCFVVVGFFFLPYNSRFVSTRKIAY